MPRCIPCIGADLRKLIIENIDDKELHLELKAIPDCTNPTSIEFCPVTGSVPVRPGKREPSEYNKFISQCMKAKGVKKFGDAARGMKECAAEWRNKKSHGR